MRLRDYRIVHLPLSLVLGTTVTKHVYADFNGIIRLEHDSDFEYLDVCGRGTIKDLNSQKIALSEGLALTLFEPEDIQVKAIMHFFPSVKDKNCPDGKWLGKYKPEDVIDSKIQNNDAKLVCFKCDYSFPENKGFNFQMQCPKCSTRITYALLPPSGT